MEKHTRTFRETYTQGGGHTHTHSLTGKTQGVTHTHTHVDG